MENISKMEMANALFNKPYIKTEKKFFGFKTKRTCRQNNALSGNPGERYLWENGFFLF